MKTRAITKTIDISSTKNTVYNALISPASIKEWWAASTAIVIPKVNGLYAATWGLDINNPDYVTHSRITEIVPNEKIKLQYLDYLSKDGALPFDAAFEVTFELTENDNLTKLTVVQDGFPTDSFADPYYQGCVKGWADVLENIKSFVENGGTNLS